MDLDSPLKRCSSAPIISVANPGPSHQHSGSISQEAGSMSSAQPIASSPSSESNRPNNLNIFSRTRRYSASSFSPLAATGAAVATTTAARRLTPRVSQLRQEECADISNSREVSHERDLHSAIQISQSWEDLTIVTENWSCRDDALANPSNCSSPSPTSRNHASTFGSNNSNNPNSIRYPFGMSPSPTRKTFATRRSMSPNHVRPSQLCPVKRKFDMEDSNTNSPPPYKKMFLDTRGGSSPNCQTMIPICPSPDSGTYEGRTTPKLYISKLCSSNSLSSFSSASASPTSQLEMNSVDCHPILKTTFALERAAGKMAKEMDKGKEEETVVDVTMARSDDGGDNCDSNNDDGRIEVDDNCDNTEETAMKKDLKDGAKEKVGQKKEGKMKIGSCKKKEIDDGIGIEDNTQTMTDDDVPNDDGKIEDQVNGLVPV